MYIYYNISMYTISQSFDNKGNACQGPQLIKHFSRSARSSSMSSSGYGSTSFPYPAEGYYS